MFICRGSQAASERAMLLSFENNSEADTDAELGAHARKDSVEVLIPVDFIHEAKPMRVM